MVQRIIKLKLKLTYEEKTFVENNRFTKLQLSGPDSSDDDDDIDVSFTPGKPHTLKHPDENEHQRVAKGLFTKRKKWNPYMARSRSEKAKSARSLNNTI